MDITATPSNFRELMGFANEVIYEDDDNDSSIPNIQKITKRNNVLPTWGNATTMNMNTLLLENIVQSSYYKNYLTEVVNFQQACEQVLHNVKHLEPWERGTRKTYGMTGMCGGVRGVGAGGVISTAFCVLYRMFALKLTRKQLVSMINSTQSVYMRGMGFLFIRYTQPPADLWAWMEPYLDDDEEIDTRAGGGDPTTIGEVVKSMLTKLDWHGTLFPRIPVPIQKDIDAKLHPKEVARPAWTQEPAEERPKPPERKRKFRCSHHLRHHHCPKHRKRCPRKAKKQKLEQNPSCSSTSVQASS